MHLKRTTLFLSLAAAAGCTNAVDTNGSLEPATSSITAELRPAARLLCRTSFPRNPKAVGFASPNILSPELIETPVAQGSFALENPQTVTLADGSKATVGFYGYLGDGPMLPAPGDLPSATHLVEASKTEPDKNTYLVLYGQTGADAAYDYGTHFIFQGHEVGAPGAITRINLDADGAHKVTVLAATDATGAPLADIDGSTWDPFAQRLVLTTENANAPTYQATLTFPSVVEDISGSVGRGGYEGVQNDDDGNLWIVEDVGGSAPAATPHSKVPNSFIYRFVPKHKDDLKARQAAGPPGHVAAYRPADCLPVDRREDRRHRRPPRLRQRVRHQVGDGPRHRCRWHDAVQRQHAGQGQAGDALQAPREWAIPARLEVPRVLL